MIEKLEREILDLLLFPETLESLEEETSHLMGKHVLSDILKQLLHHGYVQSLIENSKGELKNTLGFDSDMLKSYRFQITAKGMNEI